MDTTTSTATFEVGTVYTTRFATDAESVLRFRVVRRSARFVTVEDLVDGATARVGVKIRDGVETALPLGSYSMAPVIRADRAEG